MPFALVSASSAGMLLWRKNAATSSVSASALTRILPYSLVSSVDPSAGANVLFSAMAIGSASSERGWVVGRGDGGESVILARGPAVRQSAGQSRPRAGNRSTPTPRTATPLSPFHLGARGTSIARVIRVLAARGL